MEPVVLSRKTEAGETLQATFLPHKGMTLTSYRLGDIEVLDQSTKEPFEESHAGLGVLIGPHFHKRNPQTIPQIPNIEKFTPHAKGDDPFTHGIGRYAPWQYTADQTSIASTLSGDDTWHDIPLKTLEGQNFKMQLTASLTQNGLNLELSVVSETCSIVGIHYYYHLPNGTGKVTSQVQDTYLDINERKKIPSNWNYNGKHQLVYDLDQVTDFAFHPYPNPLSGHIVLETSTHQLITRYTSPNQENAWQLWHPKGASFACIEPVSSQDPRHVNLSVSNININLEITK